MFGIRLKNKPFVFSEGLLNVIGYILMCFGYAAFFLLYYSAFITFDEYTTLLPYIEAFNNIGLVAVPLFLFTTLEAMSINKSHIKLSLFFFFGGIVYYLTEVFIILIATYSNIIQPYFAEVIVGGVLPGNVPFSLFSFAVLYIILFYEPKKVKEKKTYLILYKSLIVFPFSYFLLSFILPALAQFEIISLSPYVSILLSGKSFFSECFAVILLIAYYFYGKHHKGEYTLKDQLIKNIIACVDLLIFVVMDWLLVTYFIDYNFYAFGSMLYSYTIIPLLLFYHKYEGERKKKEDIACYLFYPVAYTLLFAAILIIYFIKL